MASRVFPLLDIRKLFSNLNGIFAMAHVQAFSLHFFNIAQPLAFIGNGLTSIIDKCYISQIHFNQSPEFERLIKEGVYGFLKRKRHKNLLRLICIHINSVKDSSLAASLEYGCGPDCYCQHDEQDYKGEAITAITQNGKSEKLYDLHGFYPSRLEIHMITKEHLMRIKS